MDTLQCLRILILSLRACQKYIMLSLFETCYMLTGPNLNSFPVQDSTIKMLADKGYNMIFSNYDALYLDCGYSAWVGEGNNWCSPYKGRGIL